MAHVKLVVLLVFIGCVHVDSDLISRTYLNHLNKMKKPLDNYVRAIAVRKSMWLRKIEDADVAIQAEFSRLNPQLQAKVDEIKDKFRNDIVMLEDMGANLEEIESAKNDWTQITNDLRERINNCLAEQIDVLDALKSTIEKSFSKLKILQKKASDCIEAVEKNVQKVARTFVPANCVEEAVKEGSDLYKKNFKKFVRRMEHTTDAHVTLSFCFEESNVKELQRKAKALIDTLIENT